MQMYYDPAVDWDTLKTLGTGLTEDAARFDAKKTRSKVLAAGSLDPQAIRRIMVRPMDQRWSFYSPIRPLWNEPRPAYYHQSWPGNAAFVSRRQGIASPEGVPFYFTSSIGTQHALSTDAYYFPIQLRAARVKQQNNAQALLFAIDGAQDDSFTANLSQGARAYLAALGIANPDADAETAGLMWMHALAIGYAPVYLAENADGIRQDWPRVPLPVNKDTLAASAALGRQIATLLDTERPVLGVTMGKPRPELGTIASITRVGGGQLSHDSGDFDLVAGWGHGGQRGIVMPGRGKVVAREYTPEEHESCAQGAGALGLPTSGSSSI